MSLYTTKTIITIKSICFKLPLHLHLQKQIFLFANFLSAKNPCKPYHRASKTIHIHVLNHFYILLHTFFHLTIKIFHILPLRNPPNHLYIFMWANYMCLVHSYDRFANIQYKSTNLSIWFILFLIFFHLQSFLNKWSHQKNIIPLLLTISHLPNFLYR